MFNVGQKVKILDDAFSGSPDERDIWARGKTGTIICDLSQAIGSGWDDFYEVELDQPFSEDDINVYPVLASEIEPTTQQCALADHSSRQSGARQN